MTWHETELRPLQWILIWCNYNLMLNYVCLRGGPQKPALAPWHLKIYCASYKGLNVTLLS
jgi:hypothetical protein